MTQRGIVEHIDGQKIAVRCIKDSDCESCSSCKNAGSEKVFQAIISHDLSVRIGDTVRVYVSPMKAITASFFVFILPLLLFFGFYATAPLLGINVEYGKTLFGVLGIAAGFCLNYVSRLSSKKADFPEIVCVETVDSESHFE